MHLPHLKGEEIGVFFFYFFKVLIMKTGVISKQHFLLIGYSYGRCLFQKFYLPITGWSKFILSHVSGTLGNLEKIWL